ncbi:conserved hypothetical protein [Nitrosococcus halophilus Nc 4]|uniref:Lipoprotein n=1 Tax=Nitrosococcus halophilus (strain Nc4) TaxID=472759 RepID=D5C596_NITHN|nr:hypothetical protein [Nitrosococcus halophilus]ADE15319.1 conserved hypothetical protein [Nitrosococcus halophilus Nc 4]
MREISYGKALGVLVLALLLASCTALKSAYPIPVDELSTPPPNHLEPDPNNSVLLLHYYRGLRSLSEGELRQELDRAWQATAKEPTAFDRLRLILLLSLPEAPFQDLEQARGMLHDFLETENAEGLYDLALLLQGFVVEEAQQERRYRLLQEKLQQKEEQVRRLRSGLKYLDGRRKQEQEWAKSLEKQLEDERGRAETLERKLEALKTIEKRLEHRNQSKENLELPEQGKELDE